MSTDTPLWEAPETAQFWPAGTDRLVLQETTSTMDEARRLAVTCAVPTWIMARRQTAAHGRRGRAWASPPGNFAATLLLRPDMPPDRAALHSFLAANALRQTLAMCVAAERLSLKWPNDVLLDGAKVAGILLESGGQGGRLDWLAVGIGVNLVTAPETAALEPGSVPPTSVAGAGGTPHSQDDMLFWLACHYADQSRLFTEFGFDPIRRLWLAHAARLGGTVTARLPNTQITGTFETVDEAGYLVLQTPKGRERIAAADVYFGAA